MRAKSEERKRALLDAAASVFADRGYEKTSVRDLARAAGMKPSSLYHYFDSKESILFAIQYETFSRLLESAADKLTSVESPRERLFIFILNHVEHFAGRISELKVCARELESLSGEQYRKVAAVRKRYFGIAIRIVKGFLSPDSQLDPWLVTANLFGALNWFYQWYPDAKIEPQKLSEQIFRLVVDGFAREPSDETETLFRKPSVGGASAEESLGELVAFARELVDDLSHNHLRERKAKEPTLRALGYMPIYCPVELLEGAGFAPVAVFGGGDRTEIIRGDAYYQSYICHIPRSALELALSGKLEPLDGMVFPATCDVLRNLSGIWQLLFGDRLSFYLDLPQNFERDIGGAFYVEELKRLWGELEKVAGRALDPKGINRAIALCNTRRGVLRELFDLRADEPWKVPSDELYIIVRAGAQLPVEEHTKILSDYLTLAARREVAPLDQSRVVIAGAFCEQPPLGLIRTLEKAGCYVVDDDFTLGWRFITSDIPADVDPFQALADAYIAHSTHSSMKYDGPDPRAERLIRLVKERRADGVILAAPSFCDPALLERPVIAKALSEAGVSYTEFKYSENTGQFAPIREQVGTFSDSIKLWSAVE